MPQKKAISEQEFMKIATKAMQDETALEVHITIADAWMLISAIQLASRHPHISWMLKKRITQIARQFEKRIVEHHPDTEPLLLMGWDDRYDVDGSK